MDEEYSNQQMSEEQQRIEREAKAFTRGFGLLSLAIAVLAAVVCFLVSILD